MTLESFVYVILIVILMVVIVYGLLYLIERCIAPIDQRIKMVLAIIMLILVILYLLRAFGGVHFR